MIVTQMGDDESSSSSLEAHHQVKEESSTGSKPTASLSFSIARLINKVPDAPQRSMAPATVGSGSNPVYPIPMWPSSRPDSLNQMLIRGVLPSSETVMVATLMRHYQQLYGQHLLQPMMSAGLHHHHQPGSNLHKVEILRSAAAAASLHHYRPPPAAPHGTFLEIFLLGLSTLDQRFGPFFRPLVPAALERHIRNPSRILFHGFQQQCPATILSHREQIRVHETLTAAATQPGRTGRGGGRRGGDHGRRGRRG